MPGVLRLLNARDVRELLPLNRCIELMRMAMRLVAEEKTLQPIRTSVRVPGETGFLGMMPGYTHSPRWVGIKVVSVFPDNHGSSLGSHQGMVLLFDPTNGTPVAAVDAGEITSIRTAAASAVATELLSTENSETLCIVGYGDQASAHLRSVSAVRPIRRALIAGRSVDRATAFCEKRSKEALFPLVPIASIREAVQQADIICTTTAAAEPILQGAWLTSGQHLNVVGSSVPMNAEVDSDTVARARYFVDFKPSALELAGEFRRAKAAGIVTEDHILGTIGDVLIGRVAGRTQPSDITLFKSLGMICEDLVSADHVFREAERLNSGTLVTW